MIALVLFLSVGSYLALSLFGAWYPAHRELFSLLILILSCLLFSQAWLFYLFFKSSAEEKLVFEKPLQRFAYASMGVVSFLVTFTLLRDGLALPLRFWSLHEPLYGIRASTTILLMALTGYGWGRINARFRISTPLVPIPVRHLPASLEGLRIVQLSDVHFGSGPDLAQVREMIRKTLELKPDLAVLTGDIIDGAITDIQAELSELSKLKPRLGVFFVLGNHECYWNHEDSIRAMREIGITVLMNEGIEIDIGGETLFLAGVTDPALVHFGGKAPEVPAVPASSCLRILLAHQPGIASKTAEHPYHLQLSGHTHGGQFFPWNLLVRRVHRHHGGLDRLKDLWIYVSHGSGYWGPPIRLGTVGEITTLEMRRAESLISS